MRDMNAVVGSHDLLLITLDTLRYDVAAESLAAGRTPEPGAVLPGGTLGAAAHAGQFHLRGARRPSSPGSCRRPTGPARTRARSRPASPAARRRRPAPASSTRADLVGRARRGRLPHGVRRRRGLLQQAQPARLGPARACSPRATGSRSSASPTRPRSRHQIARAEQVVAGLPRTASGCSCFVNVSALHQPNCFYLPGAARGEDSRATHAAALDTSTATSAACSPCCGGRRARHRLLRPRHRLRRGRLHRATGSAMTSSGPCRTPSSSCQP